MAKTEEFMFQNVAYRTGAILGLRVFFEEIRYSIVTRNQYVSEYSNRSAGQTGVLFDEEDDYEDSGDKQDSDEGSGDEDYGNTGCQVFKGRVQNQKDFCLKINIPKGSY